MNSVLFRVLLLMCGLGCATAGQGADPVTAEPDDSPPAVGWVERERFLQTGRETQELYRMRVTISNAVRENFPLAAPADASSSEPELAARMQPSPLPLGTRRQYLLLAAVLPLVGIAVCRRVVTWSSYSGVDNSAHLQDVQPPAKLETAGLGGISPVAKQSRICSPERLKLVALQ
jgi:hypothetical protein